MTHTCSSSIPRLCPRLAAPHAVIHNVASHLQALCFVWSLFCFPWIPLQGAELTDLSDWCIGGRLVSYCFPQQRSLASFDNLICPSYVDKNVSDSLYCGEKWVIWWPKNFHNLWVVSETQNFFFFCLTSRLKCSEFQLLHFIALCNFSLVDFPNFHVKIVITPYRWRTHLKPMNSFRLVWVCTWKLSHRSFLDVSVHSLVYPCTFW